jgi:hypothetical protein
VSVRGLNWQQWAMKFVAGLDQKTDVRALAPPGLSRAVDLQMDEVGGAQTRYPYVADANSILGGSTLANCRTIVQNGDEWLLFTKDTLYSWSPQLQKWVSKGTHLACKLTEQAQFVNTTDQIDCDRAELDGTIVFAWTESGASSACYVAAVDKTTKNVIMQPTEIAGASRLRVVALETKILLTFEEASPGPGNQIGAYALDPASPSTALGGASTTIATTTNEYYDVVKIPDADQAVFAARLTPTTSYMVGTVTASLVAATSTKARTCDGPIAVSPTPDGASAQVVRGNTTNVQGDLVTISTLADVYTAQAIGTAPSNPIQIAAAHRSVADSGQYRCYVIWSNGQSESTVSTSFGTKYNWVDTGNTLGTQDDFVDFTGVVSRAFDHEGRVYVWLGFAATSLTTAAGLETDQVFGQLQNTYFLYRDDVFLCAKATPNIAGGYATSTGRLPGVANVDTNQYAWCGAERRALALGGKLSGYSARAPRDILVEFDSDEARRCARLGETLYITGGEILQYDGTQLTEVGFHVFPWQLDLIDFAAGTVGAGTYAYQTTWRYDNARGERERSASATAGFVDVAANREVSVIGWCNLNITHKTDKPPAAEHWRTPVDPNDDAPFYLVTNPDPTDTAGDNCHLSTDVSGTLSALIDSFADATLTVKEAHPENGGQLKNLSPPAASLILATDTRLFLAGVSGDPHRVLYSKYRGANQVASFFGTLAVDIPQEGGAITALALLNETVVVFRESAIYAIDGQGYDNTGGGTNYVARKVPGKVGAVSQEAVSVATERGIYFKSKRGWYLLNHGWQVEYVGGGIVDYDSEEVLAVDAIEKQHQIRILTASRMLVLDTLVGQWFEWSISDGVHSCMFDGAHAYLTSTGPKTQATSYASGATYGIDIETAFIRLNDLQGYGAVDYFDLLGEFRSACTVRIRLARDDWKDGADTYFQDKTHTPSLTAGKPLELRHRPSIRQCKSLKVRITVTPSSSGEAVKLTGLAFMLGVQSGLNRNLLTAQKQ